MECERDVLFVLMCADVESSSQDAPGEEAQRVMNGSERDIRRKSVVCRCETSWRLLKPDEARLVRSCDNKVPRLEQAHKTIVWSQARKRSFERKPWSPDRVIESIVVMTVGAVVEAYVQ